MRDELKKMLVRHEGLRLKPYRCSADKLTIGIGRNLDDVGISNDEAMMLLDNDIAAAEGALRQALPWTESLDDSRKLVLVNMTFNLGIGGLLEFKRTLALIESGRYQEAAGAMLNSKWARQVGSRAVELSKIMETGKL
jgi:lysozyme